MEKTRYNANRKLVCIINHTKNLKLSIYITWNDHICCSIHNKLLFHYQNCLDTSQSFSFVTEWKKHGTDVVPLTGITSHSQMWWPLLIIRVAWRSPMPISLRRHSTFVSLGVGFRNLNISDNSPPNPMWTEERLGQYTKLFSFQPM